MFDSWNQLTENSSWFAFVAGLMIPGNSVVCFNMYCGVLTRGLMVKTLEIKRQAGPGCAFIGSPGEGSLDLFPVCLLQPGSRLSLSLESLTQGSSFISHCPKGKIFGKFRLHLVYPVLGENKVSWGFWRYEQRGDPWQCKDCNACLWEQLGIWVLSSDHEGRAFQMMLGLRVTTSI